MKKRILLGLALLIVLLLALLAYVALPVRDDLLQARAILSGPIEELTDEKVRDANASINRALTRLDGIPARILGFIPIAGDNLEAIEDVAARIPPALTAGLEVKARVDDLEQRGIFEDGRVRLDALADLRGPLEDEVAALGALEQTLSENRNGRLWPTLWESFDELLYDVRTLREDAAGFTQVLASVDSLLAEDGKKTYLTLLLNNAELRGAGGILTGIGTMTAENGKLRTSGFTSVHALRTEKRFKVPVPKDFKRFRIYGANDTSIFLNTTYSPDVPDVAIVAARLYERVTGIKTHGAIAIDPRGVAALMPQDVEIRVPKSDVTLRADELAEFIYSDAYEEFTDQQQRREAILQVGERAFDEILDADLDDREDLERAADTIGGGHLRFVSFDDTEQAALRAVDATGDLEPAESDSLFVAVQNRGGGEGVGSKMDYWTSRNVAHGCELRSEEAMTCVTSVTLTNEAPRGLPSYVTGGNKPYALMRAFVEVFVPASAEVEAVERDGEEAALVIERQAERTSLGLSTTIPRGESTRIQAEYTLPIEDGYSLVASPQPLTEDANIEVALGVPDAWTVRGPGRWEDDIFRYEGTFDETLSISAAPAGRTGLPALWESLKSFWSEPLL